jgi:hypothetical protein
MRWSSEYVVTRVAFYVRVWSVPVHVHFLRVSLQSCVCATRSLAHSLTRALSPQESMDASGPASPVGTAAGGVAFVSTPLPSPVSGLASAAQSTRALFGLRKRGVDNAFILDTLRSVDYCFTQVTDDSNLEKKDLELIKDVLLCNSTNQQSSPPLRLRMLTTGQLFEALKEPVFIDLNEDLRVESVFYRSLLFKLGHLSKSSPLAVCPVITSSTTQQLTDHLLPHVTSFAPTPTKDSSEVSYTWLTAAYKLAFMFMYLFHPYRRMEYVEQANYTLDKWHGVLGQGSLDSSPRFYSVRFTCYHFLKLISVGYDSGENLIDYLTSRSYLPYSGDLNDSLTRSIGPLFDELFDTGRMALFAHYQLQMPFINDVPILKVKVPIFKLNMTGLCFLQLFILWFYYRCFLWNAALSPKTLRDTSVGFLSWIQFALYNTPFPQSHAHQGLLMEMRSVIQSCSFAPHKGLVFGQYGARYKVQDRLKYQMSEHRFMFTFIQLAYCAQRTMEGVMYRAPIVLQPRAVGFVGIRPYTFMYVADEEIKSLFSRGCVSIIEHPGPQFTAGILLKDVYSSSIRTYVLSVFKVLRKQAVIVDVLDNNSDFTTATNGQLGCMILVTDIQDVQTLNEFSDSLDFNNPLHRELESKKLVRLFETRGSALRSDLLLRRFSLYAMEDDLVRECCPKQYYDKVFVSLLGASKNPVVESRFTGWNVEPPSLYHIQAFCEPKIRMRDNERVLIFSDRLLDLLVGGSNGQGASVFGFLSSLRVNEDLRAHWGKVQLALDRLATGGISLKWATTSFTWIFLNYLCVESIAPLNWSEIFLGFTARESPKGLPNSKFVNDIAVLAKGCGINLVDFDYTGIFPKVPSSFALTRICLSLDDEVARSIPLNDRGVDIITKKVQVEEEEDMDLNSLICIDVECVVQVVEYALKVAVSGNKDCEIQALHILLSVIPILDLPTEDFDVYMKRHLMFPEATLDEYTARRLSNDGDKITSDDEIVPALLGLSFASPAASSSASNAAAAAAAVSSFAIRLLPVFQPHAFQSQLYTVAYHKLELIHRKHEAKIADEFFKLTEMSGYAEANMAKYCAASAGILPITPSVSISAASLPSSPGAGAAAAAAQQSNARKRSGEFSGEDESPTSKQKATFESLAAQNPFPSSTTSRAAAAAAEEEGSHLAEMNECAM